MASSKNVSRSSWSEMPHSQATDFQGIYNLRFSPNGKWAFSAEDTGLFLLFRFLNMATGELKNYTCNGNTNGRIIESYYHSENDVTVVFIIKENNTIIYNPRQFTVSHEEETMTMGDACAFVSDIPEQVPFSMTMDCYNEGINKIVIQGKEFAPLLFNGDLILLPWDCTKHNTGTMIHFLFESIGELEIMKYPLVVGSKIYLPLFDCVTSETTGDKLQRHQVNRLACIDLTDIDTTQHHHEICEDSSCVSIVDLTPLTKHCSTTTEELYVQRCGKYFIAHNDKLDSKKRPASNRNVYICDLEKKTVRKMKARFTRESRLTITRDSLFIWRNLKRLRKTFTEYKFISIPGAMPNLLETIARKLILSKDKIDKSDRKHIHNLIFN